MSDVTPSEPTGPLPDPPPTVSENPVVVPVPMPPTPVAPQKQDDGLLPKWVGVATLRDGVLFGLGLCIMINEIFLKSGGPDSVLIGLGATLVGLPVVLRTDKSTRG